MKQNAGAAWQRLIHSSQSEDVGINGWGRERDSSCIAGGKTSCFKLQKKYLESFQITLHHNFLTFYATNCKQPCSQNLGLLVHFWPFWFWINFWFNSKNLILKNSYLFPFIKPSHFWHCFFNEQANATQWTLPFHGAVGVWANPSSSMSLSSHACLTSNLSNLRVAMVIPSCCPPSSLVCKFQEKKLMQLSRFY